MILCDYSSSTRFVFSCNDSTKLIEPLQSRCAVLRFQPLGDNDIKSFLIRICLQEQIQYEENAIDTLVFIAEGDMRNAINNLQAVFVARKLITKQNIFDICDVPDTD